MGAKLKSPVHFAMQFRKLFPNTILISDYKDCYTMVRCKCSDCGFEWDAKPRSLMQGSGGKCPSCKGGHKIRTHEQFVFELDKIWPNIEIREQYHYKMKTIHCRCKIDGFEWDVKPRNLLIGCGCHECTRRKHAEQHRKTHKQFIEQLYKINPLITVLGTYTGCRDKILCHCKKCGSEWSTNPCDLLQGHSCPKCNRSYGEKKIANWLKSNQIDFIEQKRFLDCCAKKPLPFDFYIPSLNLCIEFDGSQHSHLSNFSGNASEEEKIKNLHAIQERDRIKTQYCIENNIKLLRISYLDYGNIEAILESAINSYDWSDQ